MSIVLLVKGSVCRHARVNQSNGWLALAMDADITPHDGQAGAVEVRDPWVIRRYHKAAAASDAAGWFDTGDTAGIDRRGYLRLTNRA